MQDALTSRCRGPLPLEPLPSFSGYVTFMITSAPDVETRTVSYN
jgi:hypothetical protein